MVYSNQTNYNPSPAMTFLNNETG